MNRRTFLQNGFLGLSALGLPSLSFSNEIKTEKAVILVFLAGGMTHYESFTAIPTAKDKYRSVTDYVDTKHGFSLGGNWTELSKISNLYSVVHSFGHSNAGHQSATNWIHTGYNLNDENQGAPQINPSMGSIISRTYGANNKINGLPTYIVLNKAFGQQSSYLGNAFNPFTYDDEGKKSLSLNIDMRRFEDRKSVLSLLDNKFSNDKKVNVSSEFKNQAYGILAGGVNKAFELNLEPEIVQNHYGSHSLSKQMLLARRLVQNGSKFVSIVHGGWDMHTDIKESMNRLVPEVDFAVARLLEDLSNQGMLENTLVVIATEFGRTPLNTGNDGQGNIRQPGRDHAPGVTPLLIAGGNYCGKGAIGKVDSNGYTVTDKAYYPIDLLHTICDHMQINSKTQFLDLSGRPRYIIEKESKVIS